MRSSGEKISCQLNDFSLTIKCFFHFVSILNDVLIFFSRSQWLFQTNQTWSTLDMYLDWRRMYMFAIGWNTKKRSLVQRQRSKRGQRELQSNVQVCFRAILLCIPFPVSHSLSLFENIHRKFLFLFCRFVDSIAYIKVHSHLLRCCGCCCCSTTHACHSNKTERTKKKWQNNEFVYTRK